MAAIERPVARTPSLDGRSLSDRELLAHLHRRAGFGATRAELETALAKGYEAVVEELVHPETVPDVDSDLFTRYYPELIDGLCVKRARQAQWLHRMVNTPRPLEEKMTLFWHGLFATGISKGMPNRANAVAQIDTFRRHALDNFRTILVELSKNPAMIFWLDNQENTKDVHNENYGRELLELFTMGVGNYTEDDVKSSARAFTGWTLRETLPRSPYGRDTWKFVYRPDLHDDGEKVFLGKRGRFGGEDIIDIIMQELACAKFIAGKLHGFFVSDVEDPAAIDQLARVFTESGGDIRAVVRALFLSEFFRSPRAYYAKVKSPVELVVGIARLVEDYKEPRLGYIEIARAPMVMGQELMDPPSVEGWHVGPEWIDSGRLLERVNFASAQVSDVRSGNKPGLRKEVERLRARGTLSPEEFVDACLEFLGPLPVVESTRAALVDFARKEGPLEWSKERDAASQDRVAELLSLIVVSREYQFA